MAKVILEILRKKPRPAKPGEINYPVFDRFTLAHLAIGVFYGLLGLNAWVSLILAVLWEIIENPLKYYFPQVFPNATADSARNSISDTVAVMSGWAAITYS